MNSISLIRNGIEMSFDTGGAVEIAIPMEFGGPQPNAFGVEPASARACEYGDLIGDTRLGGSCNFEKIELIPHCNGTHTESIGHITNERISVRECLRENFLIASVISVNPAPRAIIGERVTHLGASEDPIITASEISSRLDSIGSSVNSPDALIVRTLPNSAEKLSRLYANEIPPYFSRDAIELIVESGFTHLLCDLPSIDRIYDSGMLENHRSFWGILPGSFDVDSGSRINQTITELIFVPENVTDGTYLLNLQIPAFDLEAAPSRPIIFPIIK